MPANKTLDEKGKKSVTIGSCGKERKRVTVVLCCATNRDKLTPLIIHHSTAKKILNKLTRKGVPINRFSMLHKSKAFRKAQIAAAEPDHDGTNSDDTGGPVDVWTSGNKTAWMNSKIMCLWLRQVFSPNHQGAILVMDNFSGHSTDAALAEAITSGVKVEFLPPNTTPVIQPLDHSLNASFKIAVRTLWKHWKNTVESKKKPRGNRQGPTQQLIEKWILMAWDAITPEHIRRCWDHTLLRPEHVVAADARLQDRRARGERDVVLPKPTIIKVDANGAPKRENKQNIESPQMCEMAVLPEIVIDHE